MTSSFICLNHILLTDLTVLISHGYDSFQQTSFFNIIDKELKTQIDDKSTIYTLSSEYLITDTYLSDIFSENHSNKYYTYDDDTSLFYFLGVHNLLYGVESILNQLINEIKSNPFYYNYCRTQKHIVNQLIIRNNIITKSINSMHFEIDANDLINRIKYVNLI